MTNTEYKIIAVYDNGGKTFDRYTVYFSHEHSRGMKECLGLSDNPNHPQGFSQFCGGRLGRHNGKKIPFGTLPQTTQNHVQMRIAI